VADNADRVTGFTRGECCARRERQYSQRDSNSDFLEHLSVPVLLINGSLSALPCLRCYSTGRFGFQLSTPANDPLLFSASKQVTSDEHVVISLRTRQKKVQKTELLIDACQH
jgi:hypothetical protein